MLRSVNTGMHSFADRGHDLYLTPPEAVRALLTDGTTTVGFVVEDDNSFFGFDRNGVLIGEYPTQRDAMRAIPVVRL
jgi:hypothetical protein